MNRLRACNMLVAQLEIRILSPWFFGLCPLIQTELGMQVFISKDDNILLVQQPKWQRPT